MEEPAGIIRIVKKVKEGSATKTPSNAKVGLYTSLCTEYASPFTDPWRAGL